MVYLTPPLWGPGMLMARARTVGDGSYTYERGQPAGGWEGQGKDRTQAPAKTISVIVRAFEGRWGRIDRTVVEDALPRASFAPARRQDRLWVEGLGGRLWAPISIEFERP
ncbi:hypothetical protein PM082_018593 [Marasmius tenuissimus]|nr:hypothetical protein PM082_018593 [Marasmius tenuissimus]